MCRKQCMKIRKVRLHGNLANYFIRTKISGKIFIFVAEGSATRAAVRASFSSPPPSLSKSMIYGESWANWRELQPPFRVLCKSRYKALSSWTKVARGSNSGVNRNRKENGNTVEGRVGNKKRGGERERRKGGGRKNNNGPRTNGKPRKRRAARRNSRAHCSSQPAFCLLSASGKRSRVMEERAFLSWNDLARRRSSNSYFRQSGIFSF